ncbi:hypothetical protein TSAR_013436, partial [Trichomalopsis sarcophagae]
INRISNKMSECRIEKKILGDGNCLFHCFSYFLFNTEENHIKIIAEIVNHVYENWEYFEPFIVGDESLQITDRRTFEMHMSMNSTYGSGAEIIAFVRLYCVRISISSTNFINTATHKKNSYKSYYHTNRDTLKLKKVEIDNSNTDYRKKKKEGDLIKNMNKKRQKDAVNNMSEVRLQKKRSKDIVENMTDNRSAKKRCKDVVQIMTDDRLKKCKDIVENMTEVRLEKNRCKDIRENMTEIRLEKKV